MNNDEYLEYAAKTLAVCDDDQRVVEKRVLRSILLNAMTDIGADCLKREIFYKDKNAISRYKESIDNLFKYEDKVKSGSETTELSHKQINLLHAFLGLESETGEIGEEVLCSILESRDVDEVNMKEEVGDILWYLAIIARECNFTFDEAMQSNVDKLNDRYKEGFSTEAAINRDVESERDILEKKS